MRLVVRRVEIFSVPASIDGSVTYNGGCCEGFYLRWVENVAAYATWARCRREAFGVEP
jgi:hypothetical protein